MKVNKVELQEALEKVKPGLANKELIEQTTSFSFMGDRVVTYNDEISISHPVKGLDVTGAVKAQALYQFLNKIKKDEIDIDWEENQVVIKSGRSKAGLVLESEIKIPIDEEIGEVGKWEELPNNFLDALKFCYPCCSRDMSRPVLTCVNIEEGAVEATDSYQIVEYVLNSKMPVKGFLLPASAVRELVRYKISEVARGESWVHFRTEDGTIFSSRMIDNDFPDTSKHLELDGLEFSFPKNVDEILGRANVFSKKESNSGDIPTVTIEINNKGIVKITSENEYGWFEEVSRSKYKGDVVRFTIGIEFMMGLFDKLQNCVIGENKIGFKGENWRHVIAMSTEKEGKDE